MAHDDSIDPLYTLGSPASTALETLAEDGNTTDLIDLYDGATGVLSVKTVTPEGGALLPGGTFNIRVTVTSEFRYVTIASMAVNTNDAFVAINGRKLKPNTSRDYNGLDAGTEDNDELCVNIPGPVCGDTTNLNPEGGEGYVHIHSGVRLGLSLPEGITVAGEDWRNPMMHVSVRKL